MLNCRYSTITNAQVSFADSTTGQSSYCLVVADYLTSRHATWRSYYLLVFTPHMYAMH